MTSLSEVDDSSPASHSMLEDTTPHVTHNSALESLGTFSRPIFVDTSAHSNWVALRYCFSLFIHVVVIIGLTLLPLFVTESLHRYTATRNLTVFPLAPSLEQRHFQQRSQFSVPAYAVFLHARLPAPVLNSSRFTRASITIPPPLDPIKIASSGLADATGNILGGLVSETPVPTVLAVPQADRRLVNLGGDIQATRVLRGLTLEYPALAKAAHVVGKVIIAALIDETGAVSNVRAISGPPILAAAAMDAVSREKFVPVVLDGEPTASNLRVEVSFTMFD